jgi:CDP-diacylglycerol--glycerol-3-phosphate 3-phosphatidyltransferase
VPAACRPGTAVAAAVVIGVAVVLGWRSMQRVVVAVEAGTPGGPLLGPRVRAWYKQAIGPVEDALVAWGVHPDALTWAQLGVSVLAGAAFAAGAVFLAGWLVIAAGTLDVLDGGVARRTGAASRHGALVDSLVDRYAEFATFLGLGAFFRRSWVLAAVAVACFGSLMVSYTRARAEGLGLTMQEGSVQRPERYVILGFGAWLSGLVAHLACALRGTPTHAVLAAAVVLLALLSTWTAVQRARHAVRKLDGNGRP